MYCNVIRMASLFSSYSLILKKSLIDYEIISHIEELTHFFKIQTFYMLPLYFSCWCDVAAILGN